MAIAIDAQTFEEQPFLVPFCSTEERSLLIPRIGSGLLQILLGPMDIPDHSTAPHADAIHLDLRVLANMIRSNVEIIDFRRADPERVTRLSKLNASTFLMREINKQEVSIFLNKTDMPI